MDHSAAYFDQAAQDGVTRQAACAADGQCSLRDLPDGARARVRAFQGNPRVRSRLHALGITPGTDVLMCGRGVNGCRVQVRDTCVVLDCEVAGNIFCDARHGDAPACGICDLDERECRCREKRNKGGHHHE